VPVLVPPCELLLFRSWARPSGWARRTWRRRQKGWPVHGS